MAKVRESRRFFSTSEVARYCSVSTDGVLKWIRSGKLPAFTTPGGHYRVRASDFRAFLARFGLPVDEAFFTARSSTRSVLIVDDDEGFRSLLRDQLASIEPRLNVDEAVDGYDAGIKIGVHTPDLVILDVSMPRVDGVSLCRSIRANPETAHVRVLAVTGLADPGALRAMDRAGADRCLQKPVRVEQLRAEIGRLLEPPGPHRAARAE